MGRADVCRGGSAQGVYTQGVGVFCPGGVSTTSPEMATEEGGTNPTGMHSCSSFFRGGITQLSKIPFD